jgi:hypothetical protein
MTKYYKPRSRAWKLSFAAIIRLQRIGSLVRRQRHRKGTI